MPSFYAVTWCVDDSSTNRRGRLLSKAGKAVMINSVAQALATYNMSEFLLPTSICGDLQRMMNGYWWGSDQRDGRGIIWQSWDGLCRRKEDLGFEIYIASTWLFLKWDKPPVGFLKWNTDAAILDQGAAMGAGFAVRNNEGAVFIISQGLSNFLIELDAKIS
ncbi:hypothetical protein POTOM_036480 [Populus tomentosa]|uniref:RNase H type-1 domain-containing protein n=1 Tax=Populus tomentosa TaxID=118781 RepID=A0A8X8CF29_POPTO|nr:hypothetical protein POTOM_036480 [Populus tomentosa]